jgi:hypothetical protein
MTDTEWGRCQQPNYTRGKCRYHLKAGRSSTFRFDRFYHRKIVLGLLDPTEEYVTQVEESAMFRGRARNDGRRLDAWTR